MKKQEEISLIRLIVKKIDFRLSEKKTNRPEICKRLGINTSSFNDWEGGSTPSLYTMIRMARELDISLDYLVSKNDFPGFPPEILDLARQISELSFQDREEIMVLVNHKLGKLPKKQKKAGFPDDGLYTRDFEPAYNAKTINVSCYVQEDASMDTVSFPGWELVFLPFLGKTAAGVPIDINAYTEEGMPFPRPLLKGKEEDYFIVKIEGDSMTEAGIHTGDYVVIRKAEEPKNGKIMLVRYGNSSTLKRVKIDKKKGQEIVYLYWEDGSGDFQMVDSSDYEIQGEFYRNIGK